MRKKLLLIGLWLGSLSSLLGQDGFPALSLQPIEIRFPTAKYVPRIGPGDSVVEGKLVYRLVGQVYPFGRGVLPVANLSGPTDQSNPWKTVSDWFVAMKTGDVPKIKALFQTEDQKPIADFYSDPQTGGSLMAGFQGAWAADAIAAFQRADHILVFVRFKMAKRIEFTSLILRKVGEQFVLIKDWELENFELNLVSFLELSIFQPQKLAELEVIAR